MTQSFQRIEPPKNPGRFIIEAVHRQFRKLTKTKDGFPNDDAPQL